MEAAIMVSPRWKLRELIKVIGSQSRAKRIFGVEQPTISRLLNYATDEPSPIFRDAIDRYYADIFGPIAGESVLPALLAQRLANLPPIMQDRVLDNLDKAIDLAEHGLSLTLR